MTENKNRNLKILEDAIVKIYNKNSSSLSFEDLHYKANHMVLYKFGDQLRSGIIDTLTHQLQAMSKSIEASRDTVFLEELSSNWKLHNEVLKIIRSDILKDAEDIFRPIYGPSPIRKIGVYLWKENVMLSRTKTRLGKELIKRIRLERLGEMINRGLVRDVFKMLIDLGMHSGIIDTLTHQLQAMSKSIEASRDTVFLEELSNNWKHHNEVLKIIRSDILKDAEDIFRPIYGPSPIRKIGVNLWKENVMLSRTKTRLGKELIEKIRLERLGEMINRDLVKDVFKMLIDLGIVLYQEVFENPFLEVSREFFRDESQRLIVCYNCSTYLKKAERRLNEEKERVVDYLHWSSEENIVGVVRNEMISNHRVGLVSQLRETGKQNVKNPENLKAPVKFVNWLLNEKDKYDKIIELGCKNDKTLWKDLNSSFEHIINLNPRSPEFVSMFMDDKMRNGIKGVSEVDVEILLNKVMVLFRYLEEKDVFEKEYRKHLAKRLLSGKTISNDVERGFVMKLKTECGSDFTSKLEKMFMDMEFSRDTTKGFEAKHGPTLAVQILTKDSWPNLHEGTCKLPSEISDLCREFEAYYTRTHKHQSLARQKNMGTTDIESTFGDGRKHNLNVSTYNMCVLMLFDDADQLSYNEIKHKTGIPSLDLQRCLESLTLVKGTNVLKKEPMGKEIGENDVFFC